MDNVKISSWFEHLVFILSHYCMSYPLDLFIYAVNLFWKQNKTSFGYKGYLLWLMIMFREKVYKFMDRHYWPPMNMNASADTVWKRGASARTSHLNNPAEKASKSCRTTDVLVDRFTCHKRQNIVPTKEVIKHIQIISVKKKKIQANTLKSG